MATPCVVRPTDAASANLQNSTTGWAENVQFHLGFPAPTADQRDAGTYPSRIGATWRYSLHTANSSPPPTIAAPSANLLPTFRTTHSPADIHTQVSVLVAELLSSIAHCPAAYGTLPSGDNDDNSAQADHHHHDSLARACIVSDASAPSPHLRRATSSSPTSSSTGNMDFGFDWGGSGGFQTRGKGKKKAAAAPKFDLGDNNDEKKDETGANDAGGDGLGGGGGDAGAGAGGDDNGGGGGNDDDWGFSTGKKVTKKKTKKQLEEEEAERKMKEEEEAQAAAGPDTNALSWADDADQGAANPEDWSMSWGGAKTKDKDKKKKKADAPPAVPDAPSFQDISLDDGAPKLDFTFDNLADTKKPETGSGFGTWGKSWDFGGIGKEEKKEEPTADFGGNNPWGFGSKGKKKTTTSGFDFGTDVGGSTNDDLNFDATDDAAETKPADDAWGFGGTGKKDKKKKPGVVEEIKEDPEPEQKEDTWGTWGATTTATAKKTTKKKKGAFDDAFALTEEEPTTNANEDSNFDWGFGGSKDKKKDLISEVDDKGEDKQDNGDDLMSGTWGAIGKKKSSKKKTDDVSSFMDLTANDNAKATSDPWSSSSNKKDQKGKKGVMNDDDFFAEVSEHPAEPEPMKEPLVVWDFGLNVKDKKKKQRAMQADGTWEVRVTQEMVDEAEAMAAKPEPEPEFYVDPEPEFEPESEPMPIEEKVPWDHGLDAKARRKMQKDMQLAGTWADRLTQEMIDQEKADIEAAATAAFSPEPDFEPYEEPIPEPQPLEDVVPLEDLVAWDQGLSPKDKKKKEKQLRLDGKWEDRITQEIIDEKFAARAAEEAAAAPEPEPEALHDPEPEPQADQTPLEDLRPWDDGLSPKDKKKKEKQLRAEGLWDDRLTQAKIDDMIAAAAFTAEKHTEPEPYLEAAVEPEPDLEAIEDKKPWDFGLNVKEKKKMEKQMRSEGTWETRLTQDMIDEEIAAAAAAKHAKSVPTPEPEPVFEAAPEPISEVVVEERKPWDYGLTKVQIRRKEKEMKLDGSWEDRLTQEIIDAEAEAAAFAAAMADEPPPPPPVEAEPRFPWDHGLNVKDKKKKEKEMKLKGTWNDRLTQEQIDEEAAAAATIVEAEPEPEAEPALEPEPAAGEPASWSFGWGGTKPKKKPVPEPEPTPQEEKTEEGWTGSWGLGFGKDKKKKKDTAFAEPDAEFEAFTAHEPEPEPELEPVKEERKADLWGAPSSTASTAAKKKKDKGAKKSGFFDPVIEEAVPEPEPESIPEPAPPVEDMWAEFGKSDKVDKVEKKSTKKGKKTEEAPPRAPSPPDFGFSADPEPEAAEVPSVDDFNWGGLDNGRKSSKSPAAEAPAKKSASSLWGFGSTAAPAAKTKKEKDKEAKAKKEAEEQAQKEEEERLQREIEEAEAAQAEAERVATEEAAEAAKAAKKSKTGKLGKTSKTVEDKKKSSDLMDLLEEPLPTPASQSKLKKTSTRISVNRIEETIEPIEEEKAEQAETTDYFSFWGATPNAKKMAGKKTPEAKRDAKTPVLTNEDDALLAELNEDEIQAILDDTPAPPSPKLSKSFSNSKSGKSSINNRIDSFENKKDKTGKTPKASEIVLINEEPEAEVALTPKELKKATKSKSSAKSSRVQFETLEVPDPIPIQLKKSKESVPGSFPGAFGDEDDDAMLTAEEAPTADALLDSEPEPVAVKSKLKKTSKVVEKKVTKATPKKKSVKEVAPVLDDPMDFVAEPDEIDELDLLDDESRPRLPTPPVEEDSKRSKPAKKERARVERSATGTWAMWGAQPTPKKAVRSKTVDDISPPSSRKAKSPPVTVKSKVVKTLKKEDVDESKTTEVTSKTSGSDKESSSKPSDRSKPTSRGISFTKFMSGSAPPSAMRNNSNLTRRDSTAATKSSSATPSRRQPSDDTGLMSPPPDESPITKKASQLMGYAVGKPSRRSSVKGKTSSYADPYPIDDDDVVMINSRVKEAEVTPRSKPRSRVVTESKRSSTKPRSKTISGDEDVVMVDSPMAMESDHERGFERPQLQRSNTSKSSKGFFGSFFGAGVKQPVERPRSAQVTDNEETTPRNRSRRRSRVMSPADGFTTDAHGETDADAARRRARRAAKERAEEDERQARESRRRERRDREKADLEARQQRAREAARKEREVEEQRKEDRRARRREKEEAERARVAQEEAEAEVEAAAVAASERRREERRRLREQMEAEAAANAQGKDGRRRTVADEEELRRADKAERTRRSKTSSGRKSTALMAEYHESRNGSGRGIKPPADKTSSWIDSQQDEPPELPPFEGTVLDESGQRARPVEAADAGRRRKDKYAGMTEDDIARHRAKRRERRIVEKSTSGGSDEKQAAAAKMSSKRQSRIYEDDFYAAEPVRAYEGRPQQTKRSSFLGKFF